ncbi:YbjQ family protein [Rhodospirillum centenum]|uniref:UPF0145 protein RC1_0146 n=1 Tax=Rhodospirillum centenum (strain ATCC 51521 / SW) TaxID=414684 RepID=B6IQ59_RHOCS|nr:YbjQ family protein [Rhodospirillum centenum]ACI97595.1 conserved hypothetical protein [Rhodospirillum centenum SW]
MIVSTTGSVPGQDGYQILGVVGGEAVLGTNFLRDMFAGIRDIFGGRSGGYQKAMREAKEHAIDDMVDQAKRMGADAIIGVTLIPYAIASDKDKMLAISASGTAVRFR